MVDQLWPMPQPNTSEVPITPAEKVWDNEPGRCRGEELPGHWRKEARPQNVDS